MDIRQQKEMLKLAIDTSLKAGIEILRIYEGEFNVEIKEDNSPLTLADKNANKIIESFLEKTGIPILSEEGKMTPYIERKKWDIFWMVDPLDGTKEFVKRNGNFTVNIALMCDNKPLLGIIYVPVSDALYFGGIELGSYKVDEFSGRQTSDLDTLISVSHKLPLDYTPEFYTIAASSSHLSQETTDYIRELEKTKGTIEIISRGSSLKICLVAEGAANQYPRFAPTMEWDIAAGHAIILGAGKDIIDHFTQKSILYNKENLLNNWFIVQSS